MSKQRYIDTHFWDDGYVLELDPTEKLVYLYLLTNPLTNICGIYEISATRIAFDTGIERGLVIKILARFQKGSRLRYSKGYVAIKKFIKHQAKNSKIKKGIELLLEKAPKDLARWVEGYPIDSPSHTNTNPNVNFNYDKGKFEGLTDDYLKELSEQYPLTNVSNEIDKMTNWLVDNPKKKRQGKRSFINNWLKRANDSVAELEGEGLNRLRQGDY